MDKSLVVQGKRIEDALDRAEILLHCPRERIAYEIMQQPRVATASLSALPCKLRVTERAPTANDWENAYAPGAEPAFALPEPWTSETIAELSSERYLQMLAAAEAEYARSTVTNPTYVPSSDSTDLEVAGNVGPSAGEIHHTGNLTVGGDVQRNVTVRATGSIHVHGDVDLAFLDAGGDITIDGEFFGTARSALGSVSCGSAQGAYVEARNGNIMVRRSALHARLFAGHDIKVGDVLMGGTAYGQDEVDARVAGSEMQVLTVITSGHNKRIEEDADEVRRKMIVAQENLQRHDDIYRQLIPAERSGETLLPIERVRLWEATIGRAGARTTLMELNKERARLLSMINTQKTSRIRIRDRVYIKTRIIIDDSPIEIEKPIQFVAYSRDYDTGALRVTPYQ